MDREGFYRLLVDNPYKAHEYVICCAGYRYLSNYVRTMAIRNKITLTILPTYHKHVNDWKAIGKIFLGEITEGEHFRMYNPKETVGLFEMSFHMRNAHWMHRNGKRIARGGSLVRVDKATESNIPGYKELLKKYNMYVKSVAEAGGMMFQPLIEWMKEHPEAMRFWEESVAKRKELQHV